MISSYKQYIVLTTKYFKELISSSLPVILFGEILGPMILYFCMHNTVLKFISVYSPEFPFVFIAGLLSFSAFSTSNVDGGFTAFLQRWTQSNKLLVCAPVNYGIVVLAMLTRGFFRVLLGAFPVFILFALLNKVHVTLGMLLSLVIFLLMYSCIGGLLGQIEALYAKDFASVSRYSMLLYLMLSLFSEGLLPVSGIDPSNLFVRIAKINPVSKLTGTLAALFSGKATISSLYIVYFWLLLLLCVIGVLAYFSYTRRRDNIIQVADSSK